MSTITVTTSESHNFLVSGLREFRSQNAKTLDAVQEIRNGLIPVLKEVHSLCSVNGISPPGFNEDSGSAIFQARAQVSGRPDEIREQRTSSAGSNFNSELKHGPRDRALSVKGSCRVCREASLSQHTLSQALLNVENVIIDVKAQRDRNGRRTSFEQVQQFLQLQKGMEDIKGLFNTMREELPSTNAQAHSTLSLPPLSNSVQRGYASLWTEIKQMYEHWTISTLRTLMAASISFICLALQNLHLLFLLVSRPKAGILPYRLTIFRYLFPQSYYFLRALHRLPQSPYSVPTGDSIRFRDILGNVRYFNSAHFCYFEVRYSRQGSHFYRLANTPSRNDRYSKLFFAMISMANQESPEFSKTNILF